MCLTIPGKIIKIKDNKALIDYGNERRSARIDLAKVRVGNYVIVQNQMIVRKMSKKEAQETLRLLK